MRKFAHLLFVFLLVFVSIFAMLIMAGVRKNISEYSYYKYTYSLVRASDDTSRNFEGGFQLQLIDLLRGLNKKFCVIFKSLDGEEVQYYGMCLSKDEFSSELKITRKQRGEYIISADKNIENDLLAIMDLKFDRLRPIKGVIFEIFSNPILSLYIVSEFAAVVLLGFLMYSIEETGVPEIQTHRLCGGDFWGFQFYKLRRDMIVILFGAFLGFLMFFGITQGSFFGFRYDLCDIAASLIVGICLYLILRTFIGFVWFRRQCETS